MPDNTTLPGTGDVIADEDVGGVKYQRMKQVDGRAGGTTGAQINDDGSALVDIRGALEMLVAILGNRMEIDPVSGRLRVSLDNIAASLTLGTLSAVTNLTNIGSFAPAGIVHDVMVTAWCEQVRRCIT